MSFTFGGVDTDSLDGVEVTPLVYPSLGGIELDTLDTPGTAGRFYGGARRLVATFNYEVTVTGNDPEQAEERKDEFMRLLDPSIGPRPLVMDTDTEWHYPEVVASQEIDWQKFAWGPGRKVIYQAEVTLETVGDPSPKLLDPLEEEFSGSMTYTHSTGSTSAYPRLEVEASGSLASVTVAGVTVEFDDDDFTDGHTVVLDWADMQFFTRDSGGQRVSSIVTRMSTYERPVLMLGQTYTISTSPSRSGTFYPNARRA